MRTVVTAWVIDNYINRFRVLFMIVNQWSQIKALSVAVIVGHLMIGLDFKSQMILCIQANS